MYICVTLCVCCLWYRNQCIVFKVVYSLVRDIFCHKNKLYVKYVFLNRNKITESYFHVFCWPPLSLFAFIL